MRAGLFVATIAVFAIFMARSASAGPALLFDPADGRVLYAEDVDDQWHPASLTKMMTAYLVFEAVDQGRLKLDQNILCSAAAFAQPPSKVGLAIGNGLTVQVALQALIVKSANDVAVMLAEAVDGTEAAFVTRMNATAKRLGMSRTNFVNANGLPAAEQVTTARDFAKLARAITRDHPGYAAYWAMPSVHLGKFNLRSHNGLLKSFEGADGMKTGFICDSGFNIVASATREGRRLMAVVLGEPTAGARNSRASELLEYGYEQFSWKALFNRESIDSRPMAADAKPVVSVRDQVTSWDCGRPARIAARKARQEARAAARAKQAKENAAKPKATPTATGSTTGSATGAAPAKPQAATQGTAPKPKVEATKPASSSAAKPVVKPVTKEASASDGAAAVPAGPAAVSGSSLPNNLKPAPKPDGLLRPTIKVSPAETPQEP